MVILRCTQKLRQRLPAAVAAEAIESTTLLGDWTCHLVRFGRIQAILCVSHVTLLPVLLPDEQAKTFPVRLATALPGVLVGLATPAQIAQEVADMADFSIASTNNRQVLGSLNDFKRMADWSVVSADPAHLLAVSRKLAEAPCKPIDYQSPERATASAFAAR
jgi:hypothetical protein